MQADRGLKLHARSALLPVVALVAAACGKALPSVTEPDHDAGSDASRPVDAAADARVDLDASSPPDGASAGGIGCNRAVDCTRVVFVTSKQYRPSDLGGVAGARAECNAHAAKSTHLRVKGHSFLPWLSDGSTSPAIAMVHGTLSYELPSGQLVSPSWSALNGPLVHAIDEDENGTSLASDQPVVWSGTNTNGTATIFHCSGWNTAAQDTATVGDSAKITTGQWSNAGTEPCDAEDHRIYCFEE